MDVPDEVTPEMLVQLKRGGDVRLPDGRPVRLARPFAPASGAYGDWSVQIGTADDAGPPRIRLSPDYGAPSPLWHSYWKIEELVPEALLERLGAWQRDFDAHYSWPAGWDSEAAKHRWAEEAADLVLELKAALGGRAELAVDLWPLEPSAEIDRGAARESAVQMAARAQPWERSVLHLAMPDDRVDYGPTVDGIASALGIAVERAGTRPGAGRGPGVMNLIVPAVSMVALVDALEAGGFAFALDPFTDEPP